MKSKLVKVVKVTARNIRDGKPTDFACPIAIALQRAIPAASGISVGELCYWYHDGVDWSFEAPKSAVDFMMAFDEGKTVRPFEFTLHRHKVSRVI